MTDYQWDPHQAPEAGVVATFKLGQFGNHRAMGFLKKGGRKRQGWYVHIYIWAPAILRLQHTMPEDEAQNAAKLILLSLKGKL